MFYKIITSSSQFASKKKDPEREEKLASSENVQTLGLAVVGSRFYDNRWKRTHGQIEKKHVIRWTFVNRIHRSFVCRKEFAVIGNSLEDMFEQRWVLRKRGFVSRIRADQFASMFPSATERCNPDISRSNSPNPVRASPIQQTISRTTWIREGSAAAKTSMASSLINETGDYNRWREGRDWWNVMAARHDGNNTTHMAHLTRWPSLFHERLLNNLNNVSSLRVTISWVFEVLKVCFIENIYIHAWSIHPHWTKECMVWINRCL